MVKTYSPPEHGHVVCPSCGAEIRAPSASRSRRVQCPKCREVVVLEPPPSPPSPKPAINDRFSAKSETARTRSEDQSLETLAARVAALEATVAALLAASPPAAEPAGKNKKLLWVATDAADPLHPSVPERELALAHNLGALSVRGILLRAPAGDIIAAERAANLKGIFEQVGWSVTGPEYALPEAAGPSLALGVPSLPVGRDAAETYLALKAAGFDPVAVLDAALSSAGGGVALSLTLPATHSIAVPLENRGCAGGRDFRAAADTR